MTDIDLEAREVLHPDGARRLEPKAAAVLAELMRAGGKVVCREALLDACWGGEAGSDEALTQAIAQLRRAFDDDPRRPRFIGTVHRTGYRWLAVAPVLEPRKLEPAVVAATRRVAISPWKWAAALTGVGVLGFAGATALAARPAEPRVEIETEDVVVLNGERVRTVGYYNGPEGEVRAAMKRSGVGPTFASSPQTIVIPERTRP
jgi:hypothetical protein